MMLNRRGWVGDREDACASSPVTLRYSLQLAALDDAPLRAALEGASILALRQRFLVAEGLPHLLRVSRALQPQTATCARGHGAVSPAPPTASPDARDTTPRPDT